MSNPNLSQEQFSPAITGSRRQYGTASVNTEPHERAGVLIDSYHWHDGDENDHYVEAYGRRIKKNGEPGNSPGRHVGSKHVPANVMDELKRLRGES